MKEQTGRIYEKRALERWENEGGEILEIALLNAKKKRNEDERRDGRASPDSKEKLPFVKSREAVPREN